MIFFMFLAEKIRVGRDFQAVIPKLLVVPSTFCHKHFYVYVKRWGRLGC